VPWGTVADKLRGRLREISEGESRPDTWLLSATLTGLDQADTRRETLDVIVKAANSLALVGGSPHGEPAPPPGVAAPPGPPPSGAWEVSAVTARPESAPEKGWTRSGRALVVHLLAPREESVTFGSWACAFRRALTEVVSLADSMRQFTFSGETLDEALNDFKCGPLDRATMLTWFAEQCRELTDVCARNPTVGRGVAPWPGQWTWPDVANLERHIPGVARRIEEDVDTAITRGVRAVAGERGAVAGGNSWRLLVGAVAAGEEPGAFLSPGDHSIKLKVGPGADLEFVSVAAWQAIEKVHERAVSEGENVLGWSWIFDSLPGVEVTELARWQSYEEHLNRIVEAADRHARGLEVRQHGGKWPVFRAPPGAPRPPVTDAPRVLPALPATMEPPLYTGGKRGKRGKGETEDTEIGGKAEVGADWTPPPPGNSGGGDEEDGSDSIWTPSPSPSPVVRTPRKRKAEPEVAVTPGSQRLLEAARARAPRDGAVRAVQGSWGDVANWEADGELWGEEGGVVAIFQDIPPCGLPLDDMPPGEALALCVTAGRTCMGTPQARPGDYSGTSVLEWVYKWLRGRWRPITAPMRREDLLWSQVIGGLTPREEKRLANTLANAPGFWVCHSMAQSVSGSVFVPWEFRAAFLKSLRERSAAAFERIGIEMMPFFDMDGKWGKLAPLWVAETATRCDWSTDARGSPAAKVRDLVTRCVCACVQAMEEVAGVLTTPGWETRMEFTGRYAGNPCPRLEGYGFTIGVPSDPAAFSIHAKLLCRRVQAPRLVHVVTFPELQELTKCVRRYCFVRVGLDIVDPAVADPASPQRLLRISGCLKVPGERDRTQTGTNLAMSLLVQVPFSHRWRPPLPVEVENCGTQADNSEFGPDSLQWTKAACLGAHWKEREGGGGGIRRSSRPKGATTGSCWLDEGTPGGAPAPCPGLFQPGAYRGPEPPSLPDHEAIEAMRAQDRAIQRRAEQERFEIERPVGIEVRRRAAAARQVNTERGNSDSEDGDGRVGGVGGEAPPPKVPGRDFLTEFAMGEYGERVSMLLLPGTVMELIWIHSQCQVGHCASVPGRGGETVLRYAPRRVEANRLFDLMLANPWFPMAPEEDFLRGCELLREWYRRDPDSGHRETRRAGQAQIERFIRYWQTRGVPYRNEEMRKLFEWSGCLAFDTPGMPRGMYRAAGPGQILPLYLGVDGEETVDRLSMIDPFDTVAVKGFFGKLCQCVAIVPNDRPGGVVGETVVMVMGMTKPFQLVTMSWKDFHEFGAKRTPLGGANPTLLQFVIYYQRELRKMRVSRTAGDSDVMGVSLTQPPPYQPSGVFGFQFLEVIRGLIGTQASYNGGLSMVLSFVLTHRTNFPTMATGGFVCLSGPGATGKTVMVELMTATGPPGFVVRAKAADALEKFNALSAEAGILNFDELTLYQLEQILSLVQANSADGGSTIVQRKYRDAYIALFGKTNLFSSNKSWAYWLGTSADRRGLVLASAIRGMDLRHRWRGALCNNKPVLEVIRDMMEFLRWADFPTFSIPDMNFLTKRVAGFVSRRAAKAMLLGPANYQDGVREVTGYQYLASFLALAMCYGVHPRSFSVTYGDLYAEYMHLAPALNKLPPRKQIERETDQMNRSTLFNVTEGSASGSWGDGIVTLAPMSEFLEGRITLLVWGAADSNEALIIAALMFCTDYRQLYERDAWARDAEFQALVGAGRVTAVKRQAAMQWPTMLRQCGVFPEVHPEHWCFASMITSESADMLRDSVAADPQTGHFLGSVVEALPGTALLKSLARLVLLTTTSLPFLEDAGHDETIALLVSYRPPPRVWAELRAAMPDGCGGALEDFCVAVGEWWRGAASAFHNNDPHRVPFPCFLKNEPPINSGHVAFARMACVISRAIRELTLRRWAARFRDLLKEAAPPAGYTPGWDRQTPVYHAAAIDASRAGAPLMGTGPFYRPARELWYGPACFSVIERIATWEAEARFTHRRWITARCSLSWVEAWVARLNSLNAGFGEVSSVSLPSGDGPGAEVTFQERPHRAPSTLWGGGAPAGMTVGHAESSFENRIRHVAETAGLTSANAQGWGGHGNVEKPGKDDQAQYTPSPKVGGSAFTFTYTKATLIGDWAPSVQPIQNDLLVSDLDDESEPEPRRHALLADLLEDQRRGIAEEAARRRRFDMDGHPAE
jgi:hypothetical protein